MSVPTPQRHVLRCRWSQRHTQSCQAPLAGLAVPLSVARRGQRCQGFVYHAPSTPAIARTRRTTCPGVAGLTHPPTPFIHAYIHLLVSFPCMFASFSLSCHFPACAFVCVCVCLCRLIGDALCAICSHPPPPPSYSPPTLPTHHKGGLNHLCASVFPQ